MVKTDMIKSEIDDRRSRSRNRSRSRSRSPQRFNRRERGRREESTQSDRMVYISNIPYDVRWMDLKDMVREKAGEVSFVEMLETTNGKSKGAAVVEFKDKESAQRCIDSMHRLEMKDRQIVVKEIRDPHAFFRKVKEDVGIDFFANKSSGRSGRSPARNRVSVNSAPPGTYETFGLSPSFLQSLGIEGPLCSRVFIANLPYNIQSGKLKDVFCLAGKVCDVDLQLDKDGKSKGLAVVEYTHPIEAVQAISMINGQRLNDRTLNVKMDRHEKAADNRRPGELPSGLSAIGMGLGANGAPLTNIAQLLSSVGTSAPSNQLDFGSSVGAQALNSMPQPLNSMSNMSSMNAMGAMNNMNSMQPARAIEDPFGRASSFPANSMSSMSNISNMGQTQSPQIMHSSNVVGQSANQSGFGSGVSASPAAFGNNQSFANSMFGNGVSQPTPFDNRSVGFGQSVAMDGTYNQMAAVAQQMQHQQQQQQIQQPANAFDRFEQPQSRQNTVRSTRVIVIRNLPSDYTWQMVRDRLRGYGDIEFADIIQPGVAKVRFKQIMEAERAMASLSGMSVEGRLINIDFGFTD